jgi:hypothetical protein
VRRSAPTTPLTSLTWRRPPESSDCFRRPGLTIRLSSLPCGRAHDLELDCSAVSIDTGTVVVEIRCYGKLVMVRINYHESNVQIRCQSSGSV